MNALGKWGTCLLLATLVLMKSSVAYAVPIDDFLSELEDIVKKEGSSFSGFSAKRGEDFFFSNFSHPEEPTTRSCATCHTEDVSKSGSHYQSGKIIDPLAPSANSTRLKEVKKVEKWFRRNCNWVLQRACSPIEKGDFLTFLKTK